MSDLYQRLFGSAYIIDVSKKASSDYQISPSECKQYETDHGLIPEDSIVIGSSAGAFVGPL